MIKWMMKNKKADLKYISSKFSISEFMAKLLVNRGIVDEKSIHTFINSKIENMHSPRAMKDIEKGAIIIKDKIKNNKKIRIIGDYDVDGVISTYILYMALKKCGANVDYEIPDRIKDGYGINIDIINKSKSDGVDTLITCDNGISAIEQIKHAKDIGMTVIVTDHHDIPFVEDENGRRTFINSDADAIINPKQMECKYEFKSLCGAGVAFKLIQILFEDFKIDGYKDFLEFVAIATICDVVDLIDENRIIVKTGLDMINNTNNIGLKALIRESGIKHTNIASYHLGFIIGPCINASGRLESAKKGLTLLTCADEEKAKIIAKEIVKINQDRKDMTVKGVEDAHNMLKNNEIKKDKVCVLYMPYIHESLAGIIAGRVKESYNVPTFILTDSEDVVKGSGRSIEEYNMFEELLKCKDLLIKFGGHPMAAGFSINRSDVDIFRKRLNNLTTLSEDDLIPKISLDMHLPLDMINFDILDDLKSMEPFGKANNRPMFADKDIKIQSFKLIGKNKSTLKLSIVSKQGRVLEGIYFKNISDFEDIVVSKYGKDVLDSLYDGDTKDLVFDIAFRPSINEYMGNKTIQIVIEHFR